MKYLQSGSRIRPMDFTKAHTEFPKKLLTVGFDDRGIYFEQMVPVKIPKILYGNIEERSKFIREAHDHYGKLGVLMEGVKGTGKSLLGNLIINQSDMPCILLNSKFPMGAIVQVYRILSQEGTPFIIFFDEFEKMYNQEEQQQMLSILDGTVEHKGLTIICTNSKVNHYMYNRPGRIMYRLEYDFLSPEEYKEIFDRILKDKTSLNTLMSRLIGYPMTYDIVHKIAAELNRGIDVNVMFEYMNIESTHSRFHITYIDESIYVNPLEGNIYSAVMQNRDADFDVRFENVLTHKDIKRAKEGHALIEDGKAYEDPKPYTDYVNVEWDLDIDTAVPGDDGKSMIITRNDGVTIKIVKV